MGKVVSVVSKLRRDRARRLRQDQTEAEARLWAALRAGRLEDWKWRRQAPVGPFVIDFLCLRVLRFWNAEVLTEPERVCWTILAACRESDPGRRGRRIPRDRRSCPPQGRGSDRVQRW